jgi:hypothetical protein
VPLQTEKGIVIGKIYLGYLFVRPFADLSVLSQKMNVSYAKHWKKRTTIEVGHRGNQSLSNLKTKY